MNAPIPAISGGDTKLFDTMFWKGITETSKKLPLRGSIGVFWQLYKDVRTCSTEEGLKKQKVNKLYPRKPEEGELMTTTNARALLGFYTFAQQTQQPYFFIKKGCKALWLVRKTSPYYYEDTGDALWYPHRIEFEFVRAVTEEEGVTRLGTGMNTMIWITPSAEPKLPPIHPEEMPPKKGSKPKAEPKAKTIPIPITPILHPTYMEQQGEPLAVEQVEIVKISPFEHNETLYYREPIKNKLYKRQANGRIGPYVGRWSTKDSIVVTDVPDSDEE